MPIPAAPQGSEWSPEQTQVLETLCNSAESVLLTGVAGCGKSTLIKAWLGSEQAPNPSHVGLVAPTGVAALNVGGCTIHRLLGLRPADNLDRFTPQRAKLDVLSRIRVLIIDEVSMVRADLFSAMDRAFRASRGTSPDADLPFGGCRVVCVGDFWQLPPVVLDQERAYLRERFGSEAGWCFLAPSFTALDARVFFLAKSYRQGADAEFAAVCNAVRDRAPNAAKLVRDTARPAEQAPAGAPVLATTKKLVEARNLAGLRACQGEQRTFEPKVTGRAEAVPKDVLETLVLRQGCRVLITRNGPDYVNGSTGELVSFSGVAMQFDPTTRTERMVEALEVRLDSGLVVSVPREEREIIELTACRDENGLPAVEKTVVATVGQWPVTLGYSITIHKSQGMSLDAAVIDLGRGAFAHGQTYVAISRIRSAAGLFLAGRITDKDMMVDPSVPAFFEGRA